LVGHADMRGTENDGIVAVVDRGDVDPGLGLHRGALIAKPFSERPLAPRVAGMDEALYDDLRIRRYRQTGMPAGHAAHRLAAIRAHHVELAHAFGHFG